MPRGLFHDQRRKSAARFFVPGLHTDGVRRVFNYSTANPLPAPSSAACRKHRKYWIASKRAAFLSKTGNYSGQSMDVQSIDETEFINHADEVVAPSLTPDRYNLKSNFRG